MGLYWLSFADTVQGVDTFLGVAIVEATSSDDAVRVAWVRGCNPGGELLLHEMPWESMADIGPEWRHRLLSKADLVDLDRATGGWIQPVRVSDLGDEERAQLGGMLKVELN